MECVTIINIVGGLKVLQGTTVMGGENFYFIMTVGLNDSEILSLQSHTLSSEGLLVINNSVEVNRALEEKIKQSFSL